MDEGAGSSHTIDGEVTPARIFVKFSSGDAGVRIGECVIQEQRYTGPGILESYLATQKVALKRCYSYKKEKCAKIIKGVKKLRTYVLF